MKIGIVIPGFSASESDWCIPAALNHVRLVAAHHEVHVFALRYPHVRHVYKVYGATVHAFGGATTGGIGRGVLIGRVLRAMLAEAQRGQFDVLHAMWADEPGFIAVVAAKFLRVRAVVSLMGGELVHLPEIGYGHQQSYSARWLITRALKHADVVTVGSQTLMARAEHSPGAGKLAYAPLGVDTTLFMPQGEAEPLAGAVCLLHVASLVPIKHQALLLEAFASVEVPDVHLHIVGDGVLYGQLQEMASRMRITERVHFHRHVRHEQLAAFYRAAHLCLLTSHYESQSMVALEAAACGKATIGTDVGLLRELVDDEWLTDDADRLAAFIKRLIRDETLRGNLQDRAHLEAVQVFSLERGVERWLALYRNQSVPKWN